MDSNFEWQKHRANERVQARLQRAEIHRLRKSAKGESSSMLGKMIRLPFAGLGGLMRRVGKRPFNPTQHPAPE